MDGDKVPAMTTLRRQLYVSLILMLTAAGIAGGVSAYFVARQEPDAFLDGQLRQIALYVGDVKRPAPPPDSRSQPLDPEDAIVIQIWDAAGVPVRLSNPAITIPRQAVTGFSDTNAVNDAWRTYTLVSPDRIIQVSQRASVRGELATDSALRAVLPILALIPLSWLVVGGVITRILKPITTLAESVRRRPAGSSQPLELAGLPSEVVPVVAAVNELLGRQHDLLESRQRFIADAAHQLRTPLTALRLQAENLSHAENLDEVAGLVGEIQGGLSRMTTLTSQLLKLARVDQPASAAAMKPHDLSDIVREVVAEALPLAESLEIDLGLSADEPTPLRCVRDDVRMMIGNLVDNAIRYSQPGGQVDVTVEQRGERVVVTVADTGPGIPEADQARVFDRFFRLPSARSDGSGLGLSIARVIANRASAEITLANRTAGEGLSAEVQFSGEACVTGP
ncbi:MAG TPA: ATP-binding protein [Arsenicitalea sp.]|jgi:two-component system OmpR family sensor kinase/two-component system sensor histidine kinase QseC|nr:ATP-binding protein [Arsenicitalea sp.]